jgi:hypothetical protein
MTTRESSTTARRGRRLRELVVDSPTSLGSRARARRWEIFARSFPDAADMRVLDLGGTVDFWMRAPLRPRSVMVMNLEPEETDAEWLTAVSGDACRASAVLAAHGLPTAYDLVFSNSLIEHVGGHAQRWSLAHEVRALAPRHWVQTPYRYFPVEPHWVFPLMQFLPVTAQATVALRWPLAPSRPPTRAEAQDSVQWVELLGIAELRGYFPGDRLVMDRVAGLVKSIVAVCDR